jgi:phosphoribosylaminoimidazole-succinocarboxamide synthase
MITVITPCKNIISDGRETFFRKMIETLYSQTYKDFEHIVVDGGSKDGSIELLEQFRKDGKINILISEEDHNVHEAMNKGIRLAKGEFIHVMNSDNYFTDDNFFADSLQKIIELNVDYTHGDRSIVSRKDGSVISIKKGDERVAFFRMPFRFQTMLIRKSVYDEIGPFDERFYIAGDYKFMLKILLSGKRGFYFDKVFICSLDGGITKDRQKCIDEVSEVIYEIYGKESSLTLDECKQIYLRNITDALLAKILANVKNERIKESLIYCHDKTQYDNIPEQNFSRGLFQVDIPEFGEPVRGKVRDNWIIETKGSKTRVMITTDRQSCFVRFVGTIPGKGQISNLISEYWFNKTKDIVPNNMIAVPHPNVLVARQAKATLPVEVVLRRYMARGITPTSIYYNYVQLGRREIYGIKFPDGLKADQEFPMGTILTPTTKAKDGYDKELTDTAACNLVDEQLGVGVWEKTKKVALELFDRAYFDCLSKGLILADTKLEFGLDAEGKLMLIDEAFTPECSRYWFVKTHEERLGGGDPKDIDKDVLVRWLSERNFKGEGTVPVIDREIITKLLEAYSIPYKIITGKELSASTSNSEEVAKVVVDYFKNIKV